MRKWWVQALAPSSARRPFSVVSVARAFARNFRAKCCGDGMRLWGPRPRAKVGGHRLLVFVVPILVHIVLRRAKLAQQTTKWIEQKCVCYADVCCADCAFVRSVCSRMRITKGWPQMVDQIRMCRLCVAYHWCYILPWSCMLSLSAMGLSPEARSPHRPLIVGARASQSAKWQPRCHPRGLLHVAGEETGNRPSAPCHLHVIWGIS